MEFWQDITALTLVAAAAVYLVRRLRRADRRRQSAACGDPLACGGCRCTDRSGCAAEDRGTPVRLQPPDRPDDRSG
jgi:hypothetical protein